MARDLWLDISVFQGSPDFSWFVALRLAGYVGVYVQLWGLGPTGNGPNPYAESVLAKARGAGLLTGGYVVVYPSSDAVWNVLSGRDAAGPEWQHVRFVAIDLEATAPMSMNKVLTARETILAQGQRPAIYTSARTWGFMFGPIPYPWADEDPLIEARYVLPSGSCPDAPPDLDWAWQPFGGWTHRSMLQYGGTCETMGVGADRNITDPERMGYLQEDNDDMAIVTEFSENALNQLSERVAETLRSSPEFELNLTNALIRSLAWHVTTPADIITALTDPLVRDVIAGVVRDVLDGMKLVPVQ